MRLRKHTMYDIVSAAKSSLDNVSHSPGAKKLRTGDIRRISVSLFRDIKDMSVDDIFTFCGELLEQRNWPMGVIAYDFAYRVRNRYSEDTFNLFEGWLEKYVRGWGDCDDFCTHAFGELICQYTHLTKNVVAWTTREEFWMRRAAAVVLIPSIFHNKYNETNPIQISDILMTDKHDLVRKGYGWMLKILSTKEPELVYNYLMANKSTMPRVSYRYAMQKMDPEKKRILMEPFQKRTT